MQEIEIQNNKTKFELTQEEQRNLIELGFYMRAEILREQFEEDIFKQSQGI